MHQPSNPSINRTLKVNDMAIWVNSRSSMNVDMGQFETPYSYFHIRQQSCTNIEMKRNIKKVGNWNVWYNDSRNHFMYEAPLDRFFASYILIFERIKSSRSRVIRYYLNKHHVTLPQQICMLDKHAHRSRSLLNQTNYIFHAVP